MKRPTAWIIAALAAALSLSIIAGAGAQGPPQPPAGFMGSVTSTEGTVAVGLSVRAFVGTTECNNTATRTYREAGTTRYFVLVQHTSTKAGCGTQGARVRFQIGDNYATQTGIWSTAGAPLQTLNLTVGGPRIATVHVAVWRRISDPTQLFLSTRPEGGRWTTHNQVLDMSMVSSSGRFNRSDLRSVNVELADGSVATVHVAVWRRISDPTRLYISTRPEGGRWTTRNEPLDMSMVSSSGRFNRSNLVEVDVEIQ